MSEEAQRGYQEACARFAARCGQERAEEEELQELQAQLAQRQRSSEGLVFKTFTTPHAQQRSGGMDAATEAAWDLWADRKIENALHDFLEDILVPTIGDALGQTRIDMRENFEKQLGELRAEVEVLRGVVKSNNVELIKRSKDVA